VSVIDTQTNRTVRTVPTGQYPTGVAVTRDGASVYVANEVSNNVTVINTRSGATEAVIPAANPVGMTTSPDGLWVYVTDVSSGKLTVIDNRTRRVTSTVSVGAIPFNAAATDHAIYVVDQGANTLAVIDPRTLKISTTVTTGYSPLARRSGGLPYDVAVNPPTSGQ
jgi:YVTN family beta-propeller protein